jgi:hypothetical protein
MPEKKRVMKKRYPHKRTVFTNMSTFEAAYIADLGLKILVHPGFIHLGTRMVFQPLSVL